MAGRLANVKVAQAIASGAACSSAITTIGAALYALFKADRVSADIIIAYGAWFVLTFVGNLFFATTAGLAWHHYAASKRWRGLFAYLLPGAAFGIALVASILLAANLATGELRLQTLISPGGVSLVLYGATLGALTALFAWLIRRPDRSPSSVIPDSAER